MDITSTHFNLLLYFYKIQNLIIIFLIKFEYQIEIKVLSDFLTASKRYLGQFDLA